MSKTIIMHIFRVGGPRETREVAFKNWPPSFGVLEKLIEPLLGDLPARTLSFPELGAGTAIPASRVHLERVRVFLGAAGDGYYTDMFVDETGGPAHKNLPVNEEATAIYENNWLQHRPGEPLPHGGKIHGTAVLFGEPVWF